MAEVELYVYDLSAGFASGISSMLLGKNIDGIWHSGIVAFGNEFYFGLDGIRECSPGGSTTTVSEPAKIIHLGTTSKSKHEFLEFISDLSANRFALGTYDLITHNCNNFANEVSLFLVNKGIPGYILSLPSDIIEVVATNAFVGALVVAVIGKLVSAGRQPESDDFERLNSDVDEARLRSAILESKRNKIKEKVDRFERKKKKKKKHDRSDSESDYFNGVESTAQYSTSSEKKTSRRFRMADNAQEGDVYQNGNSKNPAEIAAQIEEQEKKEREERRRQREPPIVFTNTINLQDEFDKVIGLVDGNIPPAEMQFFEELHQYMLEDEGSWAIGDGFLCFIGKLLSDSKFPEELKVRLLNVLAVAALKEDMILVLHQDRREHVFMNYAYNFDRLPVEEQTSLALFVCNLFENPSSSEWLLYISEWESGSSNISNIRVTTKIAANSLLSENANLQNYGTAIVHNLACKEVKSVVFDDVAVELTMAVLQFFNSKPDEEKVFRCMKALAKFIEVSPQDVSQLIQMIGPQPDKFRGISERVDTLVSAIMARLR